MSRIHIRWASVAASLAMVFVITTVATAQQRGRGFGRFGTVSQVALASLDQLQAELKINDAQKSEATQLNQKLGDDMRELFQGGGGGEGFAARIEKINQLTTEATEKLVSHLDEAQRQRLQEVYIQVNGASVLTDEPIMKALQVTQEQKDKLAEVSDANSQALRDSFGALRDASPEERREKRAALRSEADEKLLALLTEPQREQFQAMRGAEIEVDLSTLRRGGRGRN